MLKTVIAVSNEWYKSGFELACAFRIAGHDVVVIRIEHLNEEAKRWEERLAYYGVQIFDVNESASTLINASTFLKKCQVFAKLIPKDTNIVYAPLTDAIAFYAVRQRRFVNPNLPLIVSLLTESMAESFEKHGRFPDDVTQLQLDFAERYVVEHSDWLVAPSNKRLRWHQSHDWRLPPIENIQTLPFMFALAEDVNRWTAFHEQVLDAIWSDGGTWDDTIPEVDVCVACFGDMTRLEQLFEGLAFQTYRNFHLHVVAEARQQEMIRNLAGKYDLPNLHFIDGSKGAGLADTWNSAASNGNAPLLVFLDPGVVPIPSMIQELAQGITTAGLDAAGSHMLSFTGAVPPYRVYEDKQSGRISPIIVGDVLGEATFLGAPNLSLFGNDLGESGVIIRRAIWEALDGFKSIDQSTAVQTVTDFLLQLIRNGSTYDILPKALSFHHVDRGKSVDYSGVLQHVMWRHPQAHELQPILSLSMGLHNRLNNVERQFDEEYSVASAPRKLQWYTDHIRLSPDFHYSEPELRTPIHIMTIATKSDDLALAQAYVDLIHLLNKQEIPYVLRIISESFNKGQPDNILYRTLYPLEEAGKVDLWGTIAIANMSYVFEGHALFLDLGGDSKGAVPLMEAMVHGVIPVVQESSVISEHIQNGTNGFALADEFIPGVVEVIDQLRQNSDQLHRLQYEAHLTAREYISKRKDTFRFHVPLPEHTLGRDMVAFVQPNGFTVSGVTNWSVNTALSLQTFGKHVAQIVHPPSYGVYTEFIPPGIHEMPVIDCEGRGVNFSKWEDLEKYIAAYCKVVPATIIPNFSSVTYAVCAEIIKNDPSALRVIGMAHSDEDFYYRTLWYHESIIHRFVAVSEDIADKLGQLLPHRQQDIILLPYGVRVSPVFEREYPSLDQPIRLAYAGRIVTWQKQVFRLIELAEMLHTADVNFHLDIYGDGADEVAFRQKLRQAGEQVNRRVTFHGSVSPAVMAGVWQSHDMMVLVSDWEGTPVSMLEAMGEGCIPVVPNVSGMKQVVRHGENGFLFPIGDLEAMAEIIQDLSIRREKLKNLGEQAHATILDGFNHEQYTERFRKIVDRIWYEPDRTWNPERPIRLH